MSELPWYLFPDGSFSQLLGPPAWHPQNVRVKGPRQTHVRDSTLPWPDFRNRTTKTQNGRRLGCTDLGLVAEPFENASQPRSAPSSAANSQDSRGQSLFERSSTLLFLPSSLSDEGPLLSNLFPSQCSINQFPLLLPSRDHEAWCHLGDAF